MKPESKKIVLKKLGAMAVLIAIALVIAGLGKSSGSSTVYWIGVVIAGSICFAMNTVIKNSRQERRAYYNKMSDDIVIKNTVDSIVDYGKDLKKYDEMKKKRALEGNGNHHNFIICEDN